MLTNTLSLMTPQVAEVDPVTGEDIRMLTEDDVIDAQGNPTELYKAGAITTLIFAKNTLTYGLYRFSLNVSMDGEIGIEHEDTAYINISKLSVIKHNHIMQI